MPYEEQLGNDPDESVTQNKLTNKLKVFIVENVSDNWQHNPN